MDLQDLKEQYLSCQKCPILVKNRTRVVFGSGNPKANVLLIGEAPGASEDRQGLPFCGLSGEVLETLLQSAGLSRNDVFITNTILCRPPDNRPPAKEEINNCHDRLEKLIAIMNPKVIVTIGNFATERVLGKTGIKKLRGKVFEHQGMKILPVIHPANYLYSGRDPELLKQMKQDFQMLAKIIFSQNHQLKLSGFK